MDYSIATKLADYESSLKHGISDYQARIDSVLNEKFHNLTNQFSTLQSQLSEQISQSICKSEVQGNDLKEQIVDSIEQIKAHIHNSTENWSDYKVNIDLQLLKHDELTQQHIIKAKNTLESLQHEAVNKIEESLTQKIDQKLNQILDDQTRFIVRQTALIENNTQQIDNLLRVNRSEFERIENLLRASVTRIEFEQIQQNISSIQDDVKKLHEPKKKGLFGF